MLFLVLSKNKDTTDIQFIDASELFKKETNNNILTDEHIQQIMESFINKKDLDHFAQTISADDIAHNDYNLSVSSYVEPKDTREVINISQLNKEIDDTVANITRLRTEIDSIVKVLEGNSAKKPSITAQPSPQGQAEVSK